MIRKGVTNAEPVVFTISGNDATSGGRTVLTVPGIDTNIPETTQNAWWVEIYRIDDYRVFSDTIIHSFTDPYVLGWREKEFDPLFGKALKLFPSGDGELAPKEKYPTYASALVRPDGKFSASVAETGYEVDPVDISKHSIGGPTVYDNTNNIWADITPNFDYPEYYGPLPELYNRSRSAYRQRIFSWRLRELPSCHRFVYPVTFRIPLPSGFRLETGDKLYCAIDGDFAASAVTLLSNGSPADMSKRLRVGLQARLFDIFGGVTTDDFKSASYIMENPEGNWPEIEFFKVTSPNDSPAMGAQEINLRQVNGSHFYPEESTDGKIGFELGEAIQQILRDDEAARTISGVDICVYTLVTMNSFSGGGDRRLEVTHRVRQIALYKRKETYDGEVYARVAGVKFGDNWGEGRTPPRNTNDPVLSPVDAIEYLMRKRDGKPEFVDAASFDVARAISHPSWFVIGRQLTEQKSTKEYIEELARHAFMGITPARDGKRRIKHLAGYDYPPAAVFTPENVLDGSVDAAPVGDLDRVYTGLEIKYDWNPANDEYRKTLFIRNTDKYVDDESFPAFGTMDPDGLPRWTKYAGGFSTDPYGNGYTNARLIWNLFGRGYLKAQRENIYRLESKWFQSNERIGFSSPTGSDAVVTLAYWLAEWMSCPRLRYTFDIPITPENLTLQLLDTIHFRDTLRTGNLLYPCRVEELRLDPAGNSLTVTASRRLVDVGNPDEPDFEQAFIEEVVGGGNEIIEAVGAADDIIETVHS